MKEITELSGDDADWVESLVRTLVTLGVSTEPTELDAFLEHARRTWTLAGSDPIPLINLVGAGIGHHLATQLGLRWVYVTDKRGPRLALYGDSKKTLAFLSMRSPEGGRVNPARCRSTCMRRARRSRSSGRESPAEPISVVDIPNQFSSALYPFPAGSGRFAARSDSED